MFNLPDIITVWNEATNDGKGNKTWSAPVTYSSRNALKQEKRTDANGDDFVSTAVFYSRGATVKIDSKVFFGTSVDTSPPATANDVRSISQIPSGAGDMKKGWLG